MGSMTTTQTSRRWPLACAAGVAARGSLRRSRPAPALGRRAASAVDVVGSGTLAWKRVAVHAQPKRGSKIGRGAERVPPRLPPAGRPRTLQEAHPETQKPTWYRISVPGRPNGRSGWVPAAAVEIRPVQKRLLVDRGERRFEFWDGTALVRTGRSQSARRAPRRRPASSTSSRSSRRAPRSSAPTPSRRARTRSSRTGPVAESSASTGRRGRGSSVGTSRTAASAPQRRRRLPARAHARRHPDQDRSRSAPPDRLGSGFSLTPALKRRFESREVQDRGQAEA